MTLEFFTPAWTPPWTAALINHLWQSTAVVLVAWLLTLSLRPNPARVRYAIWMIASIKFLFPFALLTGLGAHWAHRNPTPQVGPSLYIIVEEISQPFQQGRVPDPRTAVATLPSELHLNITSIAARRGVDLRFLAMLVMWIVRWRRAAADGAKCQGRCRWPGSRCSSPRREKRGNQEADSAGLFTKRSGAGNLRSDATRIAVADRSLRTLDDAQIEAIMSHEVEHVCRRDNLTVAIHAFVEALFWFHPLVRWMSVKMNEERERACDERVLERDARPEAYADGILKVCAFCLEPPSPCVSGVSGADLKDRILRIMAQRSGTALNSWRKILLASAAILALAMPVGIGVVHGQAAAGTDNPGQATTITADLPKYDVASIKPYKTDDRRVMMMITPDGVSLQGVPMRLLLPQAFGVEEDRILGEPAWVKSNRYDIEAKVEPDNAPKLKDMKVEQRNAMMLQLLVDRFNLKYHYEKRELPMYALVVAKDGSEDEAHQGRSGWS